MLSLHIMVDRKQMWGRTKKQVLPGRYTPWDLLPLTWPHLLRLPESSKTALTIRSLRLGQMRLWGAFHVQIRAPAVSPLVIYVISITELFSS